MVLCDLLIRLAQRGLYRALWSREILEEVVRSIARRRPDLSVTLLRKRIAAMQTALQDATVEGYEALLPALQELADDAHVAAAAVLGRALTSSSRATFATFLRACSSATVSRCSRPMTS